MLVEHRNDGVLRGLSFGFATFALGVNSRRRVCAAVALLLQQSRTHRNALPEANGQQYRSDRGTHLPEPARCHALNFRRSDWCTSGAMVCYAVCLLVSQPSLLV